MRSGIISVTFRPKSPSEIVSLSKKADLDSIIWGGDVHVPHGDLAAAQKAAELCRNAGIDTSVYGSYYKLSGEGFENVIKTAEELGSDVIRIWAGTKGSTDVSEEDRDKITRQLVKDAALASSHGLGLAFEYHGGTLTDNADSALRLVSEAGLSNVRLHWQPNQYRDFDFNVTALKKVAELVDAVHVFAWVGDGRYPLSTQEREWRTYFDILRCNSKCSLAALEFVPNETEDELMRDAELLHRMLEG